MGGKDRRQITLDREVNDAISEKADNFSDFVDKVARIKYVEGRGHAVERVLTDEVDEEIRSHISQTEDKLEAMRESAETMRKHADSVEETADKVEQELNERRGLLDDVAESAKESIEDDEEDITSTSVTDEATWDEVVEELGDMSYETLAWHREDVGSPSGELPGHTGTVNEALKNQAEKLGIHHDELLDKLVEEGHVKSEPRFESTTELDSITSTDEDE